ncbi:MAG TPA: hybrid sensor histidine kinase/response regulator, partial [Vicinamibacteria bacterium]|nr:hybrid sensor histidine kinase/response regulator [Vicinamibacteria bacterium]
AHELNNPLSVVIGQATLMLATGEGGKLRAEKIARAAERCVRIVRNFLALARRHPQERQPVDLPRLVRDTLEILAYGLRVDGITVSVDLPDRMPRLPGEADRLRQVLVNLVLNAQHALRQRPAGRRLEVRLEADAPAQVARLVVEDNGPGIPADLAERIFEPFFTTKPAREGTGLGLPLCRTIVEDHGGALRVESVPGEGARFVAELALSAPSAEAASPAPAGNLAPGPRAILVVDDEPDLAALMADALALAGHTVEAVTTTAEAIDRLRARDYDLVLSDVRMPDMDGPRLYQEVQRLRPGNAPRFVFVTGDTLAPGTAAFVRRIGAPVVSKPFALEELVQAAGRALGA